MSFALKDLDRLRAIAHAAGEAVMEVYACGNEFQDKSDASPLTEADVRADAIICSGLQQAFAGVAIVSEESHSSGSATNDAFFLVDPLDGTKEFLKRNGEFTVNIALVAGGVPVAGVVLAPALGQCYFAARGLGAWKAAAGALDALHVRRYESGSVLRIVGSRSHAAERLSARVRLLSVAHTFVPVGSSLKFCRVAEGQADVYPRFGPTSQWDTAAAQCILESAGGWVRDMAGQDLRYRPDRSVLNPEFLAMGDPSVFAFFREDS